MDIYETVMVFSIIMIFALSELGAHTAWKHLKSVDFEKNYAHFLYLIHLLSYAIIAGYIHNFSYFNTAVEGSEALLIGQSAVYAIFISNLAPVFYLQWDFQKYFRREGKGFVKREKAWN